MFETLEQFGITQQILQVGIVLVLVAVVLALYWRLLAIGGGILLCAFIFLHQNVLEAKPVDPEVAKLNQVQVWKKQFLEDCVSVSMNSKSDCETIWNERESEITGDN